MTHIEAAERILAIWGSTSQCLLRISLLFGATDTAQSHAASERKEHWNEVFPDLSDWLPNNRRDLPPELRDLYSYIEKSSPDGNFIEDYRASRIRDIESFSEKDAIGVASSMRAAALILTHSHIDESLNQAVHTCITFDPEAWNDRIVNNSGSTFTLKGALNINREAELTKATRHYMNGVKHQSLPKRYLLLQKYCFEAGGTFNQEPMSEDKLKEFDDRRHKLIHDVGFLHESVDSGIEVQCLAMLAALHDLTLAIFGAFEVKQKARDYEAQSPPKRIAQ